MVTSISQSQLAASHSAVNREISDTTKKVAHLITATKIFICLGVLAFAILNPYTLGALSLTALAAHSLTILAGFQALNSAAIIISVVAIGILKRKEPESPRDTLDQPLKLRNGYSNCWANSMLQFIMNVPSVRNYLRNVNRSNRLYFLRRFVEQYERDSRDRNISTSRVDSQKIREGLSALNRLISNDIKQQQDVSEGFQLISECLPRVTCKRYSGNREISSEEHDFIKLHIPTRNNSLYGRMLSYFSSARISLKDLISNFMDGDAYNSRFNSAPQELMLSLVRFGRDEKGILYKIDTEIDIPADLELKRQTHVLQDEAKYKLDTFIIHLGKITDLQNSNGGHYVSYVKKPSGWYLCNDAIEIQHVSEEEALNAARQGYLFHYTKI